MTEKPIYKVYPNGFKQWILNHERHREDGPACEWSDGFKEWRVNDQLHREDGPAIESNDGSMTWYLNNKRLYPEEVINDPELQAKYPKLIESMIIYLVHNL